MHELGYCASVLEAVERRAAGRPVARIGVRVGALHRIEQAAFEQSFQLIAAGSVAEGARAEVVTVPARARCRQCGTIFDSAAPVITCLACGEPGVDVTGGDELVLEWVEYREAADPALRAAGGG